MFPIPSSDSQMFDYPYTIKLLVKVGFHFVLIIFKNLRKMFSSQHQFILPKIEKNFCLTR